MKPISIVIPTKNAGPEFRKTLHMIRNQKINSEVEIIVIDSGSTDDTLSICKQYGVKTISIKQSEFSHGGTRNYGISIAKGKYVVLLVQDAIPADENWLSAMVDNFIIDENIAGVYSRQIPRLDCNIFTKHALENWITFGKDRVEQYIKDHREYEKMTPLEKQMLVTFDNVSSCIRKSVWIEFNFGKVNFGEDIEWSKRVIEAGKKIVYEPKSAVIHSHNRTVWYETKRTYVCHKTLKDMFGTCLVPTLGHAMQNLSIDISMRIALVKKSKSIVSCKLKWYINAMLLSIGMQVGMYLGAKYSFGKSKFLDKLDNILSKGV